MDLNFSSMNNFSAYIRKVLLDPVSEEAMNVKVQLFVKQKIGASAKSALASDSNNLFVMVLLTTSKKVADRIYFDRNRLLGYTDGKLREKTQVKIFSMSELGIGDTDDGQRIPLKKLRIKATHLGSQSCFNIPLEVSFRTPSSLQNLNIFVLSYRDSGLNTNLRSSTQEILMNRVVSEQVIKGGSVNAVSTFFQDNGKLWLGDVHRDTNLQWRSGKYQGNSGTPLKAIQINNSKINDLRDIKGLEAFKISLQKEIFNLQQNRSSDQRRQAINDIQDNTRNYLSDILFAKTKNNNLFFYFSFNYLEAIRQNALYANLYSYVPELLSTCDVLSMKIVRRRVVESNKYNKLTGGNTPDRLFEDVHAQEAHLEEVSSSLIRINIGSSNPGVLNFMGSDPEMDSLTYGLYEYGIEMEILDRSGEKLKSTSFGLQKALASLEAFLMVPMHTGGYDAATDTFAKNSLSELPEGVPAPWIAVAQLYGTAIRLLMGLNYSFNDTGIDSIVNKLSRMGNPILYGAAGPRFLIKLGQSLVATIDETLDNYNILAEDSLNATPPMSYEKLGQRKNVFKIQQFFNRAFDADSLTNGGLDYFNIKPNTSSRGHLGLVSHKNIQAVINNQTKKTASKLGPADPIFITPNVVDINSAGTKTFGKSNLDLEEMEFVAYRLIKANLTKNSPLTFDIAEPSLKGDQTELSNKKVVTIQNQVEIINYNNCEIAFFENLDDISHLSLAGDTDCLGKGNSGQAMVDSELSLSKTSKFISERPQINEKGDVSPSTMYLQTGPSRQNYGKNIEEGNSLLINYLLEADYFNGSQNSITKNIKSVALNNVLKTKDISLEEYKKYLLDRVSNPPANLSGKGIYKKRSPPDEVAMVTELLQGTVKPENFSKFALSYGFIQQIEFLSGYRMAGGSPITSLLKEPNWKPLTMGKIEDARSDQQMLLCRLRPYSTFLADLEGLSVSIYNEVFLLGNQLQSTPLPMSSPSVSIGAAPQEFSHQHVDIIEYAMSYDGTIAVATRHSPRPAGLGGSSSVARTTFKDRGMSLVGRTTYDDKHTHEYSVDAQGNGIAKEMCVPGHDNICHTHKIINGVVQSAESKTINDKLGYGPHIHRLKKKGITIRRSKSEKKMGPATKTTRMRSGGGSGY